jgi:hypothetical protein
MHENGAINNLGSGGVKLKKDMSVHRILVFIHLFSKDYITLNGSFYDGIFFDNNCKILYNQCMSSITIDGGRVSLFDAISWANKQFGNTFIIQHQFPSTHWKFDFRQPEQATLFALQWVQ